MHHKFSIEKVTKLPDSEAQITGEVTLPFLVACRTEALKTLNKNISLPGFRSGHIPEEVLVKQLGEMRVLEETAEVALAQTYPEIIEESKLKVIARPIINITKMVPGSPLAFEIKVAIEPEFDLPDYKKIAKEVLPETPKDSETPEEANKRLEKRRLTIVERLVKATEVVLPKMLIESEVHHMLHHFKQDIEKAGIKWQDYLGRIKKSEEEVLADWREGVIGRAKSEIILAKIAEKENLKTYKEVFELLEG